MSLIVLPVKNNRIERFAAEELSKYLNRISNKKIEITTQNDVKGAFFVACLPDYIQKKAKKSILKKLSKIDEDSFMLKSINENLIILGKSSRPPSSVIESLG